MSRLVSLGALLIGLALPLTAGAQSNDNSQDKNDKNFDIRSSVGDLHIGADADARKIGLPLYPGARLKNDEQNGNKVNMGVSMEAFGFQLVVANYDSDDAPAKVIDFYRDKLKKYGKVLECHTQKHGGDVNAHSDDEDDKDSGGSKEKDQASRPLKCDDNSGGPVTELKAGTENNQHAVAVSPSDSGKGATFALVYVRTRGKQGDI